MRVSATDAITDFIRAMELEGVKPVEPIAQRLASRELIRFRCDGDGKGRQNGWAKLYLDERPAGAFGNYRLGIDRKWKLGSDVVLSPAERAQLQREWAEAKQRRAEEKARSEAEAAYDAEELWGRSSPASAAHPYAARKAMDVLTLRQVGDRLLVPMFDGCGSLWNLQQIFPDGTKRFLRGGKTIGLFAIIGQFGQHGETACIGEGYSTMAAVHKAAGYPCIVSFSAKNMAPVARLWASARPDLDLVVCADDDAHLGENVGLLAAEAAARAIGARLARPLGRAA